MPGDNTSENRNPKSEIKLVCFDVGNVLLRLCAGWRGVCEHLGLPRPRCLDDDASMNELRAAAHEFECGRMDGRQFVDASARLTGLTTAQAAAALDAWLVEPFAGIVELMHQLIDAPNRRAALACLSNTNEVHWALMNGDSHAGLPLPRLDHRFASHLIGAMKPDERIYEHVERSTGIEPGAILFFDDGPDNIEAARRRGWHGEWIDPAGDPAGQLIEHLRRRRVI